MMIKDWAAGWRASAAGSLGADYAGPGDRPLMDDLGDIDQDQQALDAYNAQLAACTVPTATTPTARTRHGSRFTRRPRPRQHHPGRHRCQPEPRHLRSTSPQWYRFPSKPQ